MTRKLDHSKYHTKFSRWIREQKKLDSKLGYTTTDIDYIWTNFKNDKFCIIEEKCRLSEMRFSQEKILKRLHELFKNDENYCGFYIIKFEHEFPEDDGQIYIQNYDDGQNIKITKAELIYFLENFEIKIEEDWFD